MPAPAVPPGSAIPRSIALTMTGISWCDFTTNAWAGCTQVPPNAGGRSGCAVCYAAAFSRRRLGVTFGPGEARRKLVGHRDRMRRLDRLASETGLAFSVFFLSLGDWLDPEVDPAWRAELVETVEACAHLTWLPLTHRPHLARKLLPASWRTAPPANVWPGVTVDHPAHGYRWNRHHLEYWGHTARAWISAEPLAASLALLDLRDAAVIIYGGASGTTDPTWEFRSHWVEEAVARYGEERIYFKQYGDFYEGARIGKKAAGRVLGGRIYDHTPWPRHRDLLQAAAAGDAAP